MLGVSLTVVNAGISELAGQGFIEVRPRHGTYVADYKTKGNTETFFAIMRYNGGKLNSDEVRSFTESRMALDPFAAGLVIERASDGQIEELGAVLARMKAAGGVKDICTLITEFFYKMYMLSGNTFFSLLYYSAVQPQIGMYRAYINKNDCEGILKNAEDIYDSIRAWDAAAARR